MVALPVGTHAGHLAHDRREHLRAGRIRVRRDRALGIHGRARLGRVDVADRAGGCQRWARLRHGATRHAQSDQERCAARHAIRQIDGEESGRFERRGAPRHHTRSELRHQQLSLRLLHGSLLRERHVSQPRESLHRQRGRRRTGQREILFEVPGPSSGSHNARGEFTSAPTAICTSRWEITVSAATVNR